MEYVTALTILLIRVAVICPFRRDRTVRLSHSSCSSIFLLRPAPFYSRYTGLPLCWSREARICTAATLIARRRKLENFSSWNSSYYSKCISLWLNERRTQRSEDQELLSYFPSCPIYRVRTLRKSFAAPFTRQCLSTA